jgi:hypothetical protein
MKNSSKSPKHDLFQFKHAILVEGKDDLEFIVSFLKKLEIDDKIYVHEVGGKSGIFGSGVKSLKMLIKDGNFKKNVRNLAIIFDEDGEKNRHKEIIKDIEKLNKENEDINFVILNNPSRSKSTKPITISISIDLLKPDLESLILKSFDNKEYKEILKNCIPKFFKCCDLKNAKPKNIIHALLSIQISKKEFKTVKDIATLAQREASAKFNKKFINYDHKEFDNIKKFLLDFIKN